MLLRSVLQGISRLQPPPMFASRPTTTAAVPGMLVASLTPGAAISGLLARSMKVVSALQKRCESCRVVRRGKIHYVYCTANPKHKARQGPKRRKPTGSHN
jgi:ribosomal protein L36